MSEIIVIPTSSTTIELPETGSVKLFRDIDGIWKEFDSNGNLTIVSSAITFNRMNRLDYQIPTTAINALGNNNFNILGFKVTTDSGAGTQIEIDIAPILNQNKTQILTWCSSVFTSKLLTQSLLQFDKILLHDNVANTNIEIAFTSGGNSNLQVNGYLKIDINGNYLIEIDDNDMVLCQFFIYDGNGRTIKKTVLKDNNVLVDTFTYKVDGRLDYWTYVDKNLSTARTQTPIYDTTNTKLILYTSLS